MEEVWVKAVSTKFPELVLDIEVSNLGNVRKIPLKKLYKPQLHRKKYYIITRQDKKLKIHHLVAESFIGKRPDEMDIKHIDGDTKNNHLSNLKYISHNYNSKKDDSEDESENVVIEKQITLNELFSKLSILEEKIDKIIDLVSKE